MSAAKAIFLTAILCFLMVGTANAKDEGLYFELKLGSCAEYWMKCASSQLALGYGITETVAIEAGGYLALGKGKFKLPDGTVRDPLDRLNSWGGLYAAGKFYFLERGKRHPYAKLGISDAIYSKGLGNPEIRKKSIYGGLGVNYTIWKRLSGIVDVSYVGNGNLIMLNLGLGI